MDTIRRNFLKLAGAGLAGLAASTGRTPNALAEAAQHESAPEIRCTFDVRLYGATGDGHTIDSPAINKAIEAAAAQGGGIVYFPAGTYASYSIRLKSHITLYLEPGATILAAGTSLDATSGGYDQAGPDQPWEKYQDFGHNHWHNSLIWGENLSYVSILGPGLIWGKGLYRRIPQKDLLRARRSGAGNKAIALKNCHNVILRDFSILNGGHFGILATGVDNLLIDGLKIDSNRDGMDIDCCHNVHISNCTVNCPRDDGICLKSSFALGYLRPTKNVTIVNCYVTGAYEIGTLLDGTFKPVDAASHRTGRIKCGTESNGGFKGITISNCVFESCKGFALETVDGGVLEDVTFTSVTLRGIRNSPLFLRLGARMRGPQGTPIGQLKRILISNITSYSSETEMPSILSGIPGHPVEDVKINDIYFQQTGGGTQEMADVVPPEKIKSYPEPRVFGPMPAYGFFIRHVKNIEFGNIEITCETPDFRPAFWMQDVDGADFFRIKAPAQPNVPTFALNHVKAFRVFGCRTIEDVKEESIDSKSF